MRHHLTIVYTYHNYLLVALLYKINIKINMLNNYLCNNKLFHSYGLNNNNSIFNLARGAQPAAVKGFFCGREIVLQNARCGGRALIKMFYYVVVKK